MLDLHALRPPRRARRVDHVAQILRCAAFAGRQARIRFSQNLPLLRLQHHDRAREPRAFPRQRRRRHHCTRTAIRENETNAVRRIIRVQRHIRRARLQHRQQRDINILGPRQQKRDAPAASRAQPAQMPRQLIRLLLQLAIRHPLIPAHERDLAWKQIRRRLEEFMQPLAPRQRGIKRRPRKLRQNPPPLRRRERRRRPARGAVGRAGGWRLVGHNDGFAR